MKTTLTLFLALVSLLCATYWYKEIYSLKSNNDQHRCFNDLDSLEQIELPLGTIKKISHQWYFKDNLLSTNKVTSLLSLLKSMTCEQFIELNTQDNLKEYFSTSINFKLKNQWILGGSSSDKRYIYLRKLEQPLKLYFAQIQFDNFEMATSESDLIKNRTDKLYSHLRADLTYYQETILWNFYQGKINKIDFLGFKKFQVVLNDSRLETTPSAPEGVEYDVQTIQNIFLQLKNLNGTKCLDEKRGDYLQSLGFYSDSMFQFQWDFYQTYERSKDVIVVDKIKNLSWVVSYEVFKILNLGVLDFWQIKNLRHPAHQNHFEFEITKYQDKSKHQLVVSIQPELRVHSTLFSPRSQTELAKILLNLPPYFKPYKVEAVENLHNPIIDQTSLYLKFGDQNLILTKYKSELIIYIENLKLKLHWLLVNDHLEWF